MKCLFQITIELNDKMKFTSLSLSPSLPLSPFSVNAHFMTGPIKPGWRMERRKEGPLKAKRRRLMRNQPNSGSLIHGLGTERCHGIFFTWGTLACGYTQQAGQHYNSSQDNIQS